MATLEVMVMFPGLNLSINTGLLAMIRRDSTVFLWLLIRVIGV